MNYCVKRRAMLIVDADAAWGTRPETATPKTLQGVDDLRYRAYRGSPRGMPRSSFRESYRWIRCCKISSIRSFRAA